MGEHTSVPVRPGGGHTPASVATPSPVAAALPRQAATPSAVAATAGWIPRPAPSAAGRPSGSRPGLEEVLWAAVVAPAEGVTAGHRGLPLPGVLCRERLGAIHYAVTTMDASGRLADRSAVGCLGWASGHPVGVRVAAGLIAVTTTREGGRVLGVGGRVRLPAAVRWALRLEPGCRLLLAACPSRRLLVAYPLAVVDAMVAGYHESVLAVGS
ncbi:MAG: hypothetical protein JXA67_02915 [Micromonosporaceae bacterium]|nr:hypothetical protein [Micromonosporaceae bacterium]